MSTTENSPVPPVPRVRLHGPGDLVQAVPYLLGFTGLCDDLALVATRDYLTVLTVRTDLGALAAGALWSATGAALASAQAGAVHLVAYPASPVTDAALRGRRRRPARRD